MTPQDARKLIDAERRRQIDVEGWTSEHDDAHDSGELLRAAVCYYHETDGGNSYGTDGKPLGWPWADMWWKPKDRTSNLVRAGALCLAESDRILRVDPGGSVAHVSGKLALIIRALCQREPLPSDKPEGRDARNETQGKARRRDDLPNENKDGFLIWWTNQNDCERITPLDTWPKWLYNEFRSRYGRAGHGRLWVAPQFDAPAVTVEWDVNANWLCAAANDAGGIVIPADAVHHVQFLPGFVTTFAMELPGAAPTSSRRPNSEQRKCLQVVAAKGGTVSHDAAEILPFCDDNSTLTKPDVFNQCHDLGWLRTSHDSIADCSSASLTDEGRAVLSEKAGDAK